MFKYKSLIVLLLGLVACNPPNKKIIQEEEDCDIKDHHHILATTDSILILADEDFKVIKQKQVEQKVFVDSLRYEIYTEQSTINTIQTELNIRMDVEKNLELTKQELESALIKCKKKEKEYEELTEKFALKSEKFLDKIEYYVNREIKLINAYSHKVDSLKQVIELLNQIPNIGKKDKRKNRKNQ